MSGFAHHFSRFASIGALLAIILDPFGLTTATEEASSRLLNQLLANIYDDGAQQRIAVVIIDDDYLRQRGSHWPLPYAEQGKLFRQLLAYRPAAVMVDLMYSYDHAVGRSNDSSQLLANVFERYHAASIPLYLANSGVSQSNTLSRFAEASQPALVSWSAAPQDYPLAAETEDGWMVTAAFALYRIHCQQHHCQSLPATAELAAAAPPMALQWGLGQADGQRHVSDTRQCPAERNAWTEAATRILQAVFWRFTGPSETRCPYHLTIPAGALATTVPEERALLKQLLADRLVLVGAAIASAEDLTHSPVHGQLPGVYAHATALDNLIQYGMHYFTAPPGIFGTEMDILDLFELAFVALLLRFQARQSLAFLPMRNVVPITAITVLVLLSCVLYALRITPVNILGLLLLTGLLLPKECCEGASSPTSSEGSHHA